MANAIVLPENQTNSEFYPTPAELIDRMMRDIDFDMISTVLEPSAGKGDIAERISKRMKSWHDLDCIEIDPDLQHILKGKGHKVVHDDFLTFDTYKRYDLIIMNPPFSNGAEHLIKALKLQANGGKVVCLLNAETLRNPYTRPRQELLDVLNQYSAKIEYIKDSFATAERRTDVEIALVNVDIPRVEPRSKIYEEMERAVGADEPVIEEKAEIEFADFIKAIVHRYKVETAATVDFINEYYGLLPYTKDGSCPILYLTYRIEGRDKDVSVNGYLEQVRLKYWKTLLASPKFTGKLTSNLQDEYRGMVEKLKDYEFSEFNISKLAIEMTERVVSGIEETIMKMFDRLSDEHSWYQKSGNSNVHYYDGWAHNKAHKVAKKVILPCYGVYDQWDPNRFRTYEAVRALEDIEKVFNYLDDGRTVEVDLRATIESAKENPKKIPCKYFDVDFFKKGTMHITFTSLELLDKFNIYAARNRRWLPPDYGNKGYDAMNTDEQAVVDAFQGREAYERVMADKALYLGDSVRSQFLLAAN